MNWKQKIRAVAVKWIVQFFIQAIKNVIAWELVMAKQEDCKHEGMDGRKFCGDCGKPLVTEEESMLESVMERVLTKHGLIKDKKEKDNPPKKETLADRLMRKK